MLYKSAFIYVHCFGLDEYSCLQSFETFYLFNLKGQWLPREKLKQGNEWIIHLKTNTVWGLRCILASSTPAKMSPRGAACVPRAEIHKDPASSKCLCSLFSPSERGKSRRKSACPWAAEMNYFSVCVGSAGRPVPALHNFPPQPRTRPRSPAVTRAPPAPRGTAPTALSHVRGALGLAKDVVRLSVTLKPRDYEVWGLGPSFMTCTMLFKGTRFHLQYRKNQ